MRPYFEKNLIQNSCYISKKIIENYIFMRRLQLLKASNSFEPELKILAKFKK